MYNLSIGDFSRIVVGGYSFNVVSAWNIFTNPSLIGLVAPPLVLSDLMLHSSFSSDNDVLFIEGIEPCDNSNIDNDKLNTYFRELLSNNNKILICVSLLDTSTSSMFLTKKEIIDMFLQFGFIKSTSVLGKYKSVEVLTYGLVIE